MSTASPRPRSANTIGSRRPATQRRGVLLLIVLSMLTLFMLLGTTFVILASRARTTSRAILRMQSQESRNSVSIQPILREAGMQVIRGTANTRSVLRGHDLLADRYGSNGGVERFVGTRSLEYGDQLLRLTLFRESTRATATSTQLTGQVLTFLDGPQGVVNTSARIVETRLDAAGNPTNEVYVLRPAALEAVDLGLLSTVWINNREFTGRGLEHEEAMLPNIALGTWLPKLGDRNEDYDRFDHQNVALASPDGTRDPVPSFHRPTIGAYWLRQYGRAVMAIDGLSRDDFTDKFQKDELDALEKILRSGYAVPPPGNSTFAHRLKASIPAKLRRSSLRPFPFDHHDGPYGTGIGAVADFTGKPLSTNLLDKPVFDVDNDGDGQLDSVWLDIGYSPFQLDEQTFLKPLVAIKCVDLDGRLNLNAHGSAVNSLPDLNSRVTAATPADLPSASGPLRPGMGFGPADVRLDALIPPNQLAMLNCGTNAMGGSFLGINRSVGNVLGRYGDVIGSESFFPDNLPRPGIPNVADGTSGYRPLGVNTTDYWSRKFLAVDHSGNPLAIDIAASLSDDIDSPYELDLFAEKDGDASVRNALSPLDQPLTPAELEAMLRPFDSDNASLLPQRGLAMLASALDPTIRQFVTTESWDTPAVIGGPPTGSLDFDPDLVRGLRMELNRPLGDGIDNDGDGTVDEPDEGDPALLTDGNDNDNDGTVDEPDERDAFLRWYTDSGLNFDVTDGSPLTRGRVPPAMRLTTGGTDLIERNGWLQPSVANPGIQARQVFAMHIYKLLRFVTDTFGSSVVFNDGISVPGLPLFTLQSGSDSGVGGDAPVIEDGSGGWLLNPQDATVASSVDAHRDRVLAQWAINIVDFFDADSTMTPFCYADANTLISGGTIQPRSVWMSHVVWGCERPEAVITETLATHDLGLSDIDPDEEDGLEQVRVPEGSLFVELHATRSPNDTNLPLELYDRVSERLDLEAVPPGGLEPVWRLAITKATPGGCPTFRQLRDHPDTEWFSPNRQSDQDGTITEDGSVVAERYVWFTSNQPTATSGPGPTRFNTFRTIPQTSGNDVEVKPGEYLVIGPRVRTQFGSNSGGGYGERSVQGIYLNNNKDISIYSLKGEQSPDYPETINRIAYSELEPAGWSNPHRIGLSISEPPADAYYPAPTAANNTYLNGISPVDTYLPPSLRSEGTYANVSTVVLQRLADPTRPHDPRAMVESGGVGSGTPLVFNSFWNPYITVDFMPVDLHVFNGEQSAAGSFHFATRQRGYDNTPDGKQEPLTSTPWRPFNPADPGDNDGPPCETSVRSPDAGQACFPFELEHTLGYLNASYGSRGPDGYPDTPMPSIPWNDRPFANAYELLLVPRTPASRLLTNFRGFDPTNDQDPDDPLGATTCGAHLMPLTSLTDQVVNLPDRPKSEGVHPCADTFAHLFSYVHVRTRFRNATQPLKELVTGPATDVSGHPITDGDSITDPSVDPTILFRPPFHRLSHYREPGRINVNSIADTRVWNAILGYGAGETAVPDWIQTDPSGGDPDAPGITDITARMLNYFQPAARGPLESEAADYVPFRVPSHKPMPAVDPSWAVASLTPPAFNPEWRRRSTPRAFSLFSDWFDDGDPDTTPPDPNLPPDSLFRLAADPDNPATDPARQAWHAFEPLMRANANTTTRSEVYAIYLTVGLFEVEKVPAEPVVPDFVDLPGSPSVAEGVQRYPDGWKLNREYGSQSGSVQRHKAFFIFDRSRPIAYETGSDHNVDDAILIERYIQ